MQNRIQTPVWVAIVALATALMIGGVTSPIVHSSGEQAAYTVASDTRTQIVFEQGFSPVVKSSAPAVVNISSSKVVRSPEGGPEAPFLSDPILRKFFGEDFMRQFRVPRERRAKIATYVDLVCAAEVAADVLGMEAYRHPGAGMSNSGAPRYWDDPSDPLNAK